MADERRLRVVRITRDLLLELLRLPPGTEVVDLSRDLYFAEDHFALKLRHPDFPEVPDGHAIPEVMPLYRAVEGSGNPSRTVVFAGWST
jgi:hypothetical protein